MTVKFEQEVTIYPPDFIKDAHGLKNWFHHDPSGVLRDAIDVRRGNAEILEIHD